MSHLNIVTQILTIFKVLKYPYPILNSLELLPISSKLSAHAPFRFKSQNVVHGIDLFLSQSEELLETACF